MWKKERSGNSNQWPLDLLCWSHPTELERSTGQNAYICIIIYKRVHEFSSCISYVGVIYRHCGSQLFVNCYKCSSLFVFVLIVNPISVKPMRLSERRRKEIKAKRKMSIFCLFQSKRILIFGNRSAGSMHWMNIRAGVKVILGPLMYCN